ncbi:MAG: hypothetical protein L6R37_004225 [Teloschistes peruensis]|nr:MAG: hypothetical protein L6R37_004225 [Teloschistes peruensis]
MQFFNTAAAATLLASILSLTSAAPAALEERQDVTTITFSGAGPNPPTYTLTPPFAGQNITITNPLSVSHISVDRQQGVCTFRGIDGGSFFTVGAATIDVGPPQTITSVKCCDFSQIGFPQYCERR